MQPPGGTVPRRPDAPIRRRFPGMQAGRDTPAAGFMEPGSPQGRSGHLKPLTDRPVCFNYIGMRTNLRHDGPEERLLGVADRLFYEQGYVRTGINQIIAEAGVAKASFYDHFPSKEHLALAYLDKRHQEWFDSLRGFVENEANPKKRISRLFDYLETWLAAVNFRGCAFLNMASEFPPATGPTVRARIVQHKAELRTYIRQLVAQARGGPAKGIADAVLVLFEGAIIETQVTADPWPIAAARTASIRLLTG
jgi:AcrR family transcriptional regulator